MNEDDVLEYEVRSAWWSFMLGWKPVQLFAMIWVPFKVGRKWSRYKTSKLRAGQT